MDIKYRLVQSKRLSSDQLQVSREGIAVIDVNGDGRKDVVITNSGDPSQPIQSNDPPITILFSNADFTFSLANTSELPPTGWVNDYVFLDSNNNGLLEIVAIDHGREIAHEAKYWSRLPVYEFDPSLNKFKNLTDLTLGNAVGFYHNAANTADINNDGLNDFIVSQMGPDNFKIFLGESSYIFKEATENVLKGEYGKISEWNSSSYVNSGAAGAIDIGGDGDYDLIVLPYSDYFTKNQAYAQVLEFENGGFVKQYMFNVRQTPGYQLPKDWGFSYFRSEDINGDGLCDIVAFAESPVDSEDGTAAFISMIQKSDGSFDVTKSFPNEPLITDRRGELFLGRVWQDYKFSLDDLDGDGDLDLYWGQWFGGKEDYVKDGIFLNDGSGHFYRDTPFSQQIASQIKWSGNGGARTYMSDVNADGIGDFLVFESSWEGGAGYTSLKLYISEGRLESNSHQIVVGGLSSQYTPHVKDGVIYLKDELMTDGVYQLDLTTRINFQDISMAFDVSGSSGQAYRLYKAAFDRMPDKEGLGYWINRFDHGADLTGVASSFIASPEFAAMYGANSTDTNFVTLLYNHVLHRDPDAEGNAYWLNALQHGVSRGAVLASFSESPENIAQTAPLIANGIQYQEWVG